MIIGDQLLRTSIEGYLTQQGVELNRSDPPGWFQWLDDEQTVFHTRCADPPGKDAIDDGKQPFNYFIRATVSRSFTGKWRAAGQDFYHETKLLEPPS